MVQLFLHSSFVKYSLLIANLNLNSVEDFSQSWNDGMDIGDT